ISVSVGDVSIAEGNSGTSQVTVTLTRDAGSASGAFAVDWATADNGSAAAGSDYTTASGTASFAAGANTATGTVDITGDTTVESNETFVVNLSNPTNGATISDAQGVVTITNDDTLSALNPGAIAFIGINTAGGPDDWLAFVALQDIAAGTVIYFSDNELV